ncbi:MAG TPA: RsiV family protein [Planococcus sp. (in: firmicutes)]|nr:RsiV family protein [Planococcus sp. (in: firmicutes)]
MKNFFVGIGVMAILVLTGCTEEKIGKEPVEIKEKVLVKEDERVKLDITIPEVDGLKGFNQQAVKLGKALEAEVRESEKALLEESTNGDVSPLHAEGEMDFVAKFVDDQTVSVLMEAYLYEAGGMHGLAYKETLNYDLQTGSVIELGDLFEGDNYVAELSELAKLKIESSDFKEWLLVPFTEIKEDQKFYLTPDDVVLVFDQYEYTAGVAGPQEVIIAKSDLKNLKDLYN